MSSCNFMLIHLIMSKLWALRLWEILWVYMQGLQQPGKPGEPGNVREFESRPKKSGKSQGMF